MGLRLTADTGKVPSYDDDPAHEEEIMPMQLMPSCKD